jgi:NAD(P)-dependent dehydrogenase (short-subunit alcohol dehydrogenase family)
LEKVDVVINYEIDRSFVENLVNSFKNVIFVLFFISIPLFGFSENADLKGKTESVSNDDTTILITGANRGIGLALAKKFHQQGYRVIATARKPKNAKELQSLGVEIVALDIADSVSVSTLKETLKGRAIDILLNNAGIGGHSTGKFKDLDIERLNKVFDVNSLGALRVIQALMPNMQQSRHKVIASVSSRMGSIQNNSGGAIGYRASKSALNSFNKSLSVEFAKQGFVFVVLHPGWVRTDMTNDRATYSTTESAQGLFRVVTGLSKDDNGKFYDLHGKSIAW